MCSKCLTSDFGSVICAANVIDNSYVLVCSSTSVIHSPVVVSFSSTSSPGVIVVPSPDSQFLSRRLQQERVA